MKQEAYLQCLSEVLANEAFQTSTIVLQFPKDNISVPIGDFGDCESESAFQDIRHTDKRFISLRRNVTIYSVKFNLNDLDQYTDSSVTQYVTIKADTVYMTDTLTINFNLTIWARTISVSHPIKLVYDRNQHNLPKENDLVDRVIQINDQVKLRSRKFGYLHLMDESINGEKSNTNCTNDQVNFILTHWYDPTVLNMMYLCSAALLKNDVESQSVGDLIDFIVRLYNDRTKIKDDVLYVNAQKYLRLKMKQEKETFHQVPDMQYSIIKYYYKQMEEEWNTYTLHLQNQSNKLEKIKKDILTINAKANEIETLLLKELESEKLYIVQLMEIMNQSWISYERYPL